MPLQMTIHKRLNTEAPVSDPDAIIFTLDPVTNKFEISLTKSSGDSVAMALPATNGKVPLGGIVTGYIDVNPGVVGDGVFITQPEGDVYVPLGTLVTGNYDPAWEDWNDPIPTMTATEDTVTVLKPWSTASNGAMEVNLSACDGTTIVTNAPGGNLPPPFLKYSNDGITFSDTDLELGGTRNIVKLKWTGSFFIVTTTDAKIFISTTGINWVAPTTDINANGTTLAKSISVRGNVTYVYDQAFKNVFTSTDGMVWTKIPVTGIDPGDYFAVLLEDSTGFYLMMDMLNPSNPSLFMDKFVPYVSDDGTTWVRGTPISKGTEYSVNSLVRTANGFMMLDNEGEHALLSEDFLTWTEEPTEVLSPVPWLPAGFDYFTADANGQFYGNGVSNLVRTVCQDNGFTYFILKNGHGIVHTPDGRYVPLKLSTPNLRSDFSAEIMAVGVKNGTATIMTKKWIPTTPFVEILGVESLTLSPVVYRTDYAGVFQIPDRTHVSELPQYIRIK